MAVLVLGVLTLVGGLGMSDTQTITGSTSVPENCVDTGMGQECFGGGTISSRTTVDNPTKGPAILSGATLSFIGLLLLALSGTSEKDEDDESDDGQLNGKLPSEERHTERGSRTMNADGGSTVTNEGQSDTMGGRTQHQSQSSGQQQRQQRKPQDQQSQYQQPSQQRGPHQSSAVAFVEKYNSEIKYYGSILGGIIITHFVVSFLFGPTFLTNGFIGRIVILLSWIGGGVLGLQFHERRYQEQSSPP